MCMSKPPSRGHRCHGAAHICALLRLYQPDATPNTPCSCLTVGKVSRRLGQAKLPLAARTQLRGTHNGGQCHSIGGQRHEFSPGGMTCMC